MSKLNIKNLCVEIENKKILRGINLEVKSGETHVIIGPNGNGKSTLAYSLMGHPSYKITDGEIFLNDIELTNEDPSFRSKSGLFLAMQYPQEISGITNSEFIKEAVNIHRQKPINLFEFIKTYESNLKKLDINEKMAHRYLNEGFSGGERKKNEILQLLMLKPKFAILDEIDSGLDVDALKIVADNINSIDKKDFGCILITHYQRILEFINPTHVHVVIDGLIVKSGGIEIVERVEKEGYNWLQDSNDKNDNA